MFPTAFEESNAVLDAPESCPVPVGPIAVCRLVNQYGVPMVVTCWKLTQGDLDEIIRTKRVWLGAMGLSMPPVWLSGERPKIEVRED